MKGNSISLMIVVLNITTITPSNVVNRISWSESIGMSLKFFFRCLLMKMPSVNVNFLDSELKLFGGRIFVIDC